MINKEEDIGKEGETAQREIYWESSEMAKLFGINSKEVNDAIEQLGARITLLETVVAKVDGYRDPVAQCYEHPLTNYQVFQIRNKSLFF